MDCLELAAKASDAAIEINNWLLKGAAPNQQVSNLARCLYELGQRPRSLYQDLVTDFIGYGDGEINSEDAYSNLRILAQDFENFQMLSRQRQEELGSLCMRLTKVSLDHSRQYHFGRQVA